MGMTKKNKNAKKQTKVVGQRKETKGSKEEHGGIDNISLGLNEPDDSSILDSSEESLSPFPLLLSSSQRFTEHF